MDGKATDARRFARYCWISLAAVVAVILWGAFVRATGAGAGCGSHWPTCNGAVVPPSPGAKTLIEYTHRLSSAAAAVRVVVGLVRARRLFPRGHRVRAAAVASVVFMGVEVLIGAGIVLLRYVEANASLARAAWMAAHLVNTLLLLAAMTLTAHWAAGGSALALRARPRLTLAGAACALGTLAVAATGAVTALGDTLFPARDLASGLAADLSSTAHLFVRLRVVHPVLAAAVALGLLALPSLSPPSGPAARSGRWLRAAVLAQLAAGLATLALLAPTALQLVHLLLADVVWVALVVHACEASACGVRAAGAASDRPRLIASTGSSPL
jgi:heme A synthase